MKLNVLLAILLASFITHVNAAEDWSSVPKKKQTKLGLYMTPAQANAYMQENAQKTLFLDVRTRAEVNFLGTPTVTDANIPYMKLNEWYAWNDKKGSFKMEVNSAFEGEVEHRMQAKGLSKNDTVIVICRSGSRSSKAADLLASLGYTKVYSIVEGYEGDKAKDGAQKGQRVVNGWKNAGMPWSYNLAKEKMYLAEAEM